MKKVFKAMFGEAGLQSLSRVGRTTINIGFGIGVGYTFRDTVKDIYRIYDNIEREKEYENILLTEKDKKRYEKVVKENGLDPELVTEEQMKEWKYQEKQVIKKHQLEKRAKELDESIFKGEYEDLQNVKRKQNEKEFNDNVEKTRKRD